MDSETKTVDIKKEEKNWDNPGFFATSRDKKTLITRTIPGKPANMCEDCRMNLNPDRIS